MQSVFFGTMILDGQVVTIFGHFFKKHKLEKISCKENLDLTN